MASNGLSNWVEQWEHEDAPRFDESDRYAIYTVPPRQGLRGSTGAQKRLCETSSDGVVPAILQMLEEEEIPRGYRVGVFDRLTRRWLVDPYA